MVWAPTPTPLQERAFLAAAVAVLTDADIPTLEQSIKLGGGFSASGSVDLGSLRNIALGASKMGISYKREDVRTGISISRAEDGKLGEKYLVDLEMTNSITRKSRIERRGITAFEIGGAIGLGTIPTFLEKQVEQIPQNPGLECSSHHRLRRFQTHWRFKVQLQYTGFVC